MFCNGKAMEAIKEVNLLYCEVNLLAYHRVSIIHTVSTELSSYKNGKDGDGLLELELELDGLTEEDGLTDELTELDGLSEGETDADGLCELDGL